MNPPRLTQLMVSKGTFSGSLLLDVETIKYWGKSHLQCAPQSAYGSLGPGTHRLSLGNVEPDTCLTILRTVQRSSR